MRLVHASACAVAVALLVPALHGADSRQDADRKVADGGIAVEGWKGSIDAGAAKKGLTIKDSKFAKEGNGFHLTIGPAAVYWNPANMAKGDFTVKATFKEPKVNLSHAHSYGVFIGGTNLDTEQRSLLYCVAYGDGRFLVRGFDGANVVTLSKPQPHAAVNKAGADGSATNEVGWTVKGNRAECVVNGTAVAGFDKSEIVGAGKLQSTDGVYGIRVSHNVDVMVSNLGMTK